MSRRRQTIDIGPLKMVKINEKEQRRIIPENMLPKLEQKKQLTVTDNELIDDLIREQLLVDPITNMKKYGDNNFIYGNYKSYYNYRLQNRWQDPRVSALGKSYFLNKEVLDIGCNDGSLDLQVAIKYFPKLIVGMDIDYKLINQAIENLEFMVKQQKISKQGALQISQCENNEETKQEEHSEMIEKQKRIVEIMEKLEKLPKSMLLNLKRNNKMGVPEIDDWIEKKYIEAHRQDIIENIDQKIAQEVQKPEQQEGQVQKLEILKKFPDNVQFRTQNYVDDITLTQKFDTIMCLSTIKWIHLNFGDKGVKRLFHKVFRSLRDGGHFILEPQDWKSYKKKKNLTDTIAKNFKSIKIKPQDFKEVNLLYLQQKIYQYLIQNYGFKLVQELTPDNSAGFKRNILIFQK